MQVLELLIDIEESITVASDERSVCMIRFGGTCRGDWFQGTILPGGVDTQNIPREGKGTLSARYMIDGVTAKGTKARMFIENNAVLGEEKTWPKIVTDCDELRWLEHAELSGRLHFEDGQLIITICAPD